MLKVVSVVAAALWATLALAGPPPPMRFYPTFKSAHVRGTVATFDIPGSEGISPTSINASGVVVGYYIYPTGTRHGARDVAFLRAADGTLTTFNAPDASPKPGGGTFADGINTAGDIAGYYVGNHKVYHGYLRLANGTFTEFNPPHSAGTFTSGINNNDTVIGFYTEDGFTERGFVRAPDGTFSTFEFGTHAPSNILFPASINDAGTIAGYYDNKNKHISGFIRASNGVITKFHVHGALDTQPAAINATGTVAGFFVNSAQINVGFLRAPNGTITTFEVAGAGTAEGQGTNVTGLDDAGDAIGNYITSDGMAHGFERSADGTVTTFDVNSNIGTYPTAVSSAGITGQSGNSGFVLNN